MVPSRGDLGPRRTSPKPGMSGPGETSCFPTKWMGADGKTLYLVFSGDDSFSVRKAIVETTNRLDVRSTR